MRNIRQLPGSCGWSGQRSDPAMGLGSKCGSNRARMRSCQWVKRPTRGGQGGGDDDRERRAVPRTGYRWNSDTGRSRRRHCRWARRQQQASRPITARAIATSLLLSAEECGRQRIQMIGQAYPGQQLADMFPRQIRARRRPAAAARRLVHRRQMFDQPEVLEYQCRRGGGCPACRRDSGSSRRGRTGSPCHSNRRTPDIL